MVSGRALAVGCIAVITGFSCIKTPSVAEDEIAPVIELLPDNQTVYVGTAWTDPGCIALDNIDGNISSKVSVTGTVSTGTPGNYSIRYTVSDKAGNNAEKMREVTVALHPDVAAWYPFYRSCRDYSGKKLHGTVKGSAVLSADRLLHAQGAYMFDGKSCIEVPYSSVLDFPGSFTVSVWAQSAIAGTEYSSKAGKVGFVLNMGTGAAADFGIFYYADPGADLSGLCFRYNGKMVIDSLLDIRLWHHYAMTFSGSELCGYVDGKKAGSVVVAKGVIDDKPFRIGCESKDLNRYWYGSIDDILIINAALSADQIEQLAHAGAFIPDTSAAVDTSKTDTTKTDTTASSAERIPKNLSASITGSTGNLSLKLSWDALTGVAAYGVYFAEGTTVTVNDGYRVAGNNYRTFAGDLTEGREYTFAVCSIVNEKESALSSPLTVVFKVP
jgi:hypothetical protein